MLKRIVLYFFVSTLFVSTVFAAEYEVVSPDNVLKIKLRVDNGTTYEVWHGQTQLINSSSIGLNLSNGMIIGAGTVKSTQTRSVNNQLEVKIGKNKTLTEAYNELTIEYNENYKLIIRAYNEGLAYRFVTSLAGEIIINSEDAIFNFTATPNVYFPECDNYTGTETGDNGVQYSIQEGYRNFERVYNIYSAPISLSDKFSVTPVLFEIKGTPYKIVVTEADTYDYPGMYMERTPTGGIRSMRGKWVQYPKSVMDPNNYYSNHLVYERENYIAKTNGTRIFPWRVIIATDNDKSLLNNQLVYMLAEPSRIDDTSWIQPGKSAWEWWHKAMLEGVDFPVGNKNLSVQLYKYYIDWASENCIEYMTFDAGYQESWLYELCHYAKLKNVKIIVWTWASNVREAPSDWVKRMKAYGVSGAKIDFFERNDQVAMRWGYEFAQRLADSKMVGLFHGCPVPTGLNRTYPNILNFEAVRGAEDNFWRSIVTPNYHTLIPFIRSIAGPEDYTPGSMRNKTAAEFYPVDKDNTVPMSMGTRAHELSMYVIYDQWLGFLCDSPTEYNKYPDIRNFLSKVPTVWDKTVPLDAQLGKYILLAKQKGNDWYVGGMSNWDTRTLTVNFDFLKQNTTYQAEIIRDASESSSEPTKYVYKTMTITSTDQLTVDLAQGGGFVIYLKDMTPNGLEDKHVSENISVSVDQSSAILRLFSENQIQSVSIYDILGKCMLNQNFQNDSESINISGFKKGVYIAKIQTEENTSSVKFIY
ncbi:MAG: glycoside hydrolase family 97 catalytic domain-containing protein [Paludibacter sp.]